jgi:hypothetical protein
MLNEYSGRHIGNSAHFAVLTLSQKIKFIFCYLSAKFRHNRVNGVAREIFFIISYVISMENCRRHIGQRQIFTEKLIISLSLPPTLSIHPDVCSCSCFLVLAVEYFQYSPMLSLRKLAAAILEKLELSQQNGQFFIASHLDGQFTPGVRLCPDVFV